MLYYVYIIKSIRDGTYYKGFSEDPYKRLIQHNNKESRYTSLKTLWQLVFIQSFYAKTDALKRERSLKKYSHEQIEQLIKSNQNKLRI
jgi:putative endonuclease